MWYFSWILAWAWPAPSPFSTPCGSSWMLIAMLENHRMTDFQHQFDFRLQTLRISAPEKHSCAA